MNHPGANPSIILSFSALDPSGCGGIQADIETAFSLGCHCAPIVTTMCAEGSQSNVETFATHETILIEQARSILDEMDVSAIKLGFLGSTVNVEAIHSILVDYPEINVVAHPALCLYDPENIDQQNFIDAYSSLILPLTSIAILSLHEAREIAMESDNIRATAQSIVNKGCDHLLITGTGKHTQQFQNSFFSAKGLVNQYSWEQEAPTCHGSSSTLAMSTASYIAHGFGPQQAIDNAQNFTWQAMRASRELGFGKRTPRRLYWADQTIGEPDRLPAKKHTH